MAKRKAEEDMDKPVDHEQDDDLDQELNGGSGEESDEEVEDEEEEEDDGDDDEGEGAGESADCGNGSLAIDENAFESPEALSTGVIERDPSKRVKFDRPKLFKSAKNQSQRLIVVLENANLELVKVGKAFELLNCDDHMSQIRKFRKDPAFCRPDITHQCLLMLFDSPLNRSGLLQVYVHTMQNILIEINPQTRLPRTFPRFANLMVQLLYKMSIKSGSGPDKLLRVIRNPITSHLPVGCKKIGTSFKADKLIHASELVSSESTDPVVIVIGAMAHGEAVPDYVEQVVSLSNYPLSGALACTRVVSAFEAAWNIH